MSFDASCDNSAESEKADLPINPRRLSLSQNKPENMTSAQQSISIDRLRSDYLALQTQYDEAMIYVSQMEELHRGMAQATKEVAKIRSEKDDIERRLQISLQLNDELTAKLNDAKRSPSGLETRFKFLYEQEKTKGMMKIKEMEDEVEKKTKENQGLRELNEKDQKDINALLETAKQRYRHDFKSCNELNEFLKKQAVDVSSISNDQEDLSNSTQVSVLNENSVGDEKSINALADKLNQMKKKLQIKKKQNKQLQMTLKELSRKYKKQGKHQQKEAKELTNQIDLLNEEIKDNEENIHNLMMEKDNKINELNIQIKSLNTQIESLNKQIQQKQMLEQQQAQQKNESSESFRINRLQDTIKDMQLKIDSQSNKLLEAGKLYTEQKKKIQFLLQQIQSTEAEKNNYMNKYKQTEVKLFEMTNQNQNINNQLQTLQIEKDKLEMQLTCNESNSKADKFEIEKKDSRIDELLSQIEAFQNELSILQAHFDKQKREISLYYKERESLVTIVHRQNSLIQQYEFQMNKIVNEKSDIIKKLQNKPNFHPENNTKLANLQPEEPIIPLTALALPDFPRDLVKSLIEIASSNGKTIAAKFAQILEKINQYYKASLTLNENKINEILLDKQQIYKILQDFLNSINKTLGFESIDPMQINDSVTKQYQEKIIQIVTDNQQLADEITKRRDSSQILLEKLGSKSISEASKQIDHLFNLLETAEIKIKKQRQKNKRLCEIIDSTQSESFVKQSELEDLIEENNRLSQSFAKEKESFIKENNENQSKYQQLLSDYNSYKDSSEDIIEKLKSDNLAKIDEITQKFQSENDELLADLQSKSNSINELNDKTQKANESRKKWQKAARILKNNCELQQHKIQELEANFSELQKKLTEQASSEKEQLQSQLKATIDQYKNKNNSLRQLLEKATNALSESDMNNRKLKATNSQLNVERKKLLGKIEAHKDELLREKQLAETKFKALQLSVDVQRHSKFETELAKQEEEKQQLITEVAQTFKSFYDANMQLDESNIRQLLENVNNELSRLTVQEKSLKSLLGLQPDDNLEDAISKLFYETHTTPT